MGDNIFYGHAFTDLLLKAKKNSGATIFTYNVKDASQFGILEFNNKNKFIAENEMIEASANGVSETLKKLQKGHHTTANDKFVGTSSTC